jgi:deoxyadenosine/deoxycytidine kinase
MSNNQTEMSTPVAIVISIDGNIGAGKTTLFRELQSRFRNRKNFVFLDEPVSTWQTICDEDGVSLLELFYKDSQSWAFSFQIAAYISRLALLKEVKERDPHAIIITERSLNTDRHVFTKMLHDQNKINKVDYQIYLKWFDTFAKDYPVQKIIYVKTEPVNCYSRIKMRAREGESVIPLDYLQLCHGYHEEMVNSYNQSQIVTIDGNVDLNENKNIMDTWFEQCENALYQYMHL